MGSYQANLTDLQLAYFTPGFGSIDTLLFRPEGLPYSPTNEATSDKYFLLDNLTFHNATSAVPEPATMSLLGLGFLGLLGLGKRKK